MVLTSPPPQTPHSLSDAATRLQNPEKHKHRSVDIKQLKKKNQDLAQLQSYQHLCQMKVYHLYRGASLKKELNDLYVIISDSLLCMHFVFPTQVERLASGVTHHLIQEELMFQSGSS